MSSVQKVLEAISDPTRRKILDLLKKSDLTAGELGSHFDISGPSMSHHLNKLKAADLVQTTRQGQSIVYSINTSVFEDTAQFVVEFFELSIACPPQHIRELCGASKLFWPATSLTNSTCGHRSVIMSLRHHLPHPIMKSSLIQANCHPSKASPPIPTIQRMPDGETAKHNKLVTVIEEL